MLVIIQYQCKKNLIVSSSYKCTKATAKNNFYTDNMKIPSEFRMFYGWLAVSGVRLADRVATSSSPRRSKIGRTTRVLLEYVVVVGAAQDSNGEP